MLLTLFIFPQRLLILKNNCLIIFRNIWKKQHRNQLYRKKRLIFLKIQINWFINNFNQMTISIKQLKEELVILLSQRKSKLAVMLLIFHLIIINQQLMRILAQTLTLTQMSNSLLIKIITVFFTLFHNRSNPWKILHFSGIIDLKHKKTIIVIFWSYWIKILKIKILKVKRVILLVMIPERNIKSKIIKKIK